jgi:hypothetical protein
MKSEDTEVCWKCHYLVTKLGFLKRKKSSGSCDMCLDEVTTMQQAMQDKIWLKYIPKREAPDNVASQNENKNNNESGQKP